MPGFLSLRPANRSLAQLIPLGTVPVVRLAVAAESPEVRQRLRPSECLALPLVLGAELFFFLAAVTLLTVFNFS